MTREEAIKVLKTEEKITCEVCKPSATYCDDKCKFIIAHDMAISALSEDKWIPFTRRPMTEEEQEDYPNCTFMFDCDLPEDGEEILISSGRFVSLDTFCVDVDGCYLDGGDDIDEDMAWQPLPKPYRAERREP